MKISGFTMMRNADKLYYPVKQSICSILPIVDEFVVALGNNDAGDKTGEIIQSIQSPKLKIINTVWDIDAFPNGMENAHQTDIAKSHCTGDWLFYLQADEVIHEKYHEQIVKRCSELIHDKRIEGLLFRYKHFWGDYNHYIRSHGWYPNEIRIIRNDPEIHSWESAQSFRRIPGFDGKNYRQQKGTFKLNVAKVNADVYHYGWVRPPAYMQAKKKSLDTIHKGQSHVNEIYTGQKDYFEYGPLKKLRTFLESHPAVMKERIAGFNWADQLDYTSSGYPARKKFKHERWKYKALTWMENTFMNGNSIGGFKNYRLIDV